MMKVRNEIRAKQGDRMKKYTRREKKEEKEEEKKKGEK